MAKHRLDSLLVQRGLVENAAKAQALVMAGKVRVNDQVVTKAGEMLRADVVITLKEAEHPYVSRAGLKLAKGIEYFQLSVAGRICADIGASTGGFTQVLLQHQAAKVYAVDVGYGQLAWSLRTDERVVVLDKTNARYLNDTQISEKLNAIVCDASFIRLSTVLPAAMALAANACWLIALIKPQFEAAKHEIGAGGIIRDPAVHAAVCTEVEAWFAQQPGWQVLGITKSPITGQEGNKEFLIAAVKQA